MAERMNDSTDPHSRNIQHDSEVAMLLYQVESIELFATLCLGRNTTVMLHLVKEGMVSVTLTQPPSFSFPLSASFSQNCNSLVTTKDDTHENLSMYNV